MIERPNPTVALDLMSKVIAYLTTELQWPLDRIHLFGFAQGGTVAAEFSLAKWKEQLQAHRATTGGSNKAAASEPPMMSIGSIVTVSGPLLSHPTLSAPSPTPVLLIYRPPPSPEALRPDAVKSLQRGFQSVKEIKSSAQRQGMPSSKQEWEPIMRFWSENLSRRRMDGLYEVMSGTSG